MEPNLLRSPHHHHHRHPPPFNPSTLHSIKKLSSLPFPSPLRPAHLRLSTPHAIDGAGRDSKSSTTDITDGEITTTSNNNNQQQPRPPINTISIRYRARSKRQAAKQLQQQQSPNPSPNPSPPKDWESMSLVEKAVELYVGEKGLLFWLNKFAYASIFIIIGGWIVFRFVGPSLGLYQLDAPPLSPTSILKG